MAVAAADVVVVVVAAVRVLDLSFVDLKKKIGQKLTFLQLAIIVGAVVFDVVVVAVVLFVFVIVVVIVVVVIVVVVVTVVLVAFVVVLSQIDWRFSVKEKFGRKSLMIRSLCKLFLFFFCLRMIFFLL